MGQPDIQLFTEPGTWRKPAVAEVIDVMLVGGTSSDGNEGESKSATYAAGELPDVLSITVNGGMVLVIAR